MENQLHNSIKKPQPRYEPEVKRRSHLRRVMVMLAKEPLVRKYRLSHDRIRVTFTTGIRENWHRKPTLGIKPEFVLPYNPCEGGEISVGHQYETNPLDDDYAQKSQMFIMRHHEWRRGSFYKRRLAIQRLIRDFKYEPLWLSQEDLRADLKKLTSAELPLYRGSIYIYNQIWLGNALIARFTGWSEAMRNIGPNALYSAIRKILHYHRDVTRLGITRRFLRCVNSICPNVYRAVMKRFEISNQVIADPSPGFGSKAIASILENCQYYSPEKFDGLARFLNTEFNSLDRDRYDCVWLDYNFRDPGKAKILSDLEFWGPKADIKLVYVPRHLAKELPKPVYMAEIRLLYFRSDDFVYYYL